MRVHYARSAISSAALAMALCGTAAAQTQDDAAPSLDSAEGEIVVVGTRAGLEQAISIKRSSSQIVDSIVAEDIGKLPDVNIAESLQRVSGVQIQRTLGEGSQISIRGLRQNITLANGREVVDAAGRGGSGIDTLGTGSYGLLAQLPSEIIQRLEVTKLPAASDIEGALSGVVNIITARPLASSKNVRAFSVEGLYNDRGEKFGFRGSALLSHRFTDNFGALINVSYSDRQIRDESVFSNIGFAALTSAFDTGATANNLGPNGTPLSRNPNGTGTSAFYIADIRNTVIDDSRERVGVNGTLQWDAGSAGEYSFDILYSRQQIVRNRDWFSVPLNTNGNSYKAVKFTPDETLISGIINTTFQGNTELYENEGTTLATGLNGAWTFGRLELNADISYSRSEQFGFQQFARLTSEQRYDIPFTLETTVPSFTIPANVNLTDPTLFAFTNFFDNTVTSEASMKAAKVDGKIRVEGNFLQNLRLGFRVSQVDVERGRKASQPTAAVPVETVPSAYRQTTIDILQGVSGYNAYPVLVPVIRTADRELACEIRGVTCTAVNDPLNSFVTQEGNFAAYVQADFETMLGAIDLSGNVGARYVITDFRADGSRIITGGATSPVRIDKTYDHFLPSMALKAGIADNFLIRLGAAKVIARPNSGDQNPGVSLNTFPPRQGSAGNAELDPFQSTQYDLSAEYYFRPESLFSVGLFRKDLSSFIVRVASEEIYDGISFTVTRPRNGAKATIQGVEVLFQMPFDFLPAPFDGFGTVNTYSFIDSTTEDVNQRTGDSLPITGLSKHNVNMTLYWEKGDVSVRAAYNWRDKYLDSIGSGGEGVFFDSSDNFSLSARWQFTDNLSFDVQGSNLFDSPVREYRGVPEATSLYALNGRTVTFALRGSF
jgi:iron complex outermembrane receptor protein